MLGTNPLEPGRSRPTNLGARSALPVPAGTTPLRPDGPVRREDTLEPGPAGTAPTAGTTGTPATPGSPETAFGDSSNG